MLVCYFGQEGGRLFGEGRLLERGPLFKEIRYIDITFLSFYPYYTQFIMKSLSKVKITFIFYAGC